MSDIPSGAGMLPCPGSGDDPPHLVRHLRLVGPPPWYCAVHCPLTTEQIDDALLAAGGRRCAACGGVASAERVSYLRRLDRPGELAAIHADRRDCHRRIAP